MKTFKSILDFQKEFSTDEKCREYLEQQRWNGTPACPFCGSINVCKFRYGRIFKCRTRHCRKKFTVTVGTIYDNSKIPLQKWFFAIYLLSNNKKGISGLEFKRALALTEKTSWYLGHRIRYSIIKRHGDWCSHRTVLKKNNNPGSSQFSTTNKPLGNIFMADARCPTL